MFEFAQSLMVNKTRGGQLFSANLKIILLLSSQITKRNISPLTISLQRIHINKNSFKESENQSLEKP